MAQSVIQCTIQSKLDLHYLRFASLPSVEGLKELDQKVKRLNLEVQTEKKACPWNCLYRLWALFDFPFFFVHILILLMPRN